MGRFVFELANEGLDNVYALQCQSWYNLQSLVRAYVLNFDPIAPPCPCNKQSAQFDERFFYDFNTHCAVTLNPDFQSQHYQVRIIDTTKYVTHKSTSFSVSNCLANSDGMLHLI